jgi:hypothetical protein
MLLWTIKISLLSILFIFLIHHLIVFFTSTLTIPKIKDLVNSPNEKYKNIYNTLNVNTQNTNTNTNTYAKNTNKSTDIDMLPLMEIDEMEMDKMEDEHMKDELKLFLKKQLSNF